MGNGKKGEWRSHLQQRIVGFFAKGVSASAGAANEIHYTASRASEMGVQWCRFFSRKGNSRENNHEFICCITIRRDFRGARNVRLAYSAYFCRARLHCRAGHELAVP